MYKIVRSNEAKLEHIDDNQHRYDFPGPISIIEAAEVVDTIISTQKQLYYILNGKMKFDDQELSKGDYVLVEEGDTMLISGTFKVLIVKLS